MCSESSLHTSRTEVFKLYLAWNMESYLHSRMLIITSFLCISSRQAYTTYAVANKSFLIRLARNMFLRTSDFFLTLFSAADLFTSPPNICYYKDIKSRFFLSLVLVKSWTDSCCNWEQHKTSLSFTLFFCLFLSCGKDAEARWQPCWKGPL